MGSLKSLCQPKWHFWVEFELHISPSCRVQLLSILAKYEVQTQLRSVILTDITILRNPSYVKLISGTQCRSVKTLVFKKCLEKIAEKKKKSYSKLSSFFDISKVGYIARPKYILKTHDFFSGKVKSLEIPRERAIDIDDTFDFKIASILKK